MEPSIAGEHSLKPNWSMLTFLVCILINDVLWSSVDKGLTSWQWWISLATMIIVYVAGVVVEIKR
ncbi:MAG: hypothetical protein LUD40_16490 [Phocaeicola dorei]|nr:hypothetical protein [Phocaeicola dorei]